jgi:cell division protein FtsQ
MDVYPIIKAQLKVKKNAKKQLNQAVDYIDLRYDTGLAVGWKTIENTTRYKLRTDNDKNHDKSVPSLKSLS